ncbi:MAG: divergent polysaccharide deacetylase family protein [Desulfuromonadaceae bacterium]|nr:divergent polysaccharide deacetylase family protein [Desulfuromonadaceae bacterium]MDD5106169.1 divergent polysaccharide deacetylase family protein [Desulfuromonadaceae bacterium]
MAVTNRNRSRKKVSGARVAVLVIVILILGSIVAYLFVAPKQKGGATDQKNDFATVKPVQQGTSSVKTEKADIPADRQVPHEVQHQYSTPPEYDVGGVHHGAIVRLAVIIDDMGNRVSEARALAAIKVPITFAIIPGLSADKNVAAFATANQIETLIHVPMQPKNWPSRRIEANGLLVNMEADELKERMSGFIQRFPEAVGVNNHMGSAFTEQEEKMTAVLQIIKNENLFFIDSMTSSESKGGKVARQLGIKFGRRNVFLDNNQERNYILGQLNQAVTQARKYGSAIAICHPHPVTMATLAELLPELAERGVQLVPVSEIVR